MREAVTQAFGVNVLALGLGAVLVAVFTTAALDVTGVLTATLFAIAGLADHPRRRRQLIRDLEEKIAKLSTDLSALLGGQVPGAARALRAAAARGHPAVRALLETERAKLETAAVGAGERRGRRSTDRGARHEHLPRATGGRQHSGVILNARGACCRRVAAHGPRVGARDAGCRLPASRRPPGVVRAGGEQHDRSPTGRTAGAEHPDARDGEWLARAGLVAHHQATRTARESPVIASSERVARGGSLSPCGVAQRTSVAASGR
jgi:hypothetical protein